MYNYLRIIFAGTPNFAALHLNALICSEHQVVGVFTQPDRPAGRGNRLTSSPVKQLADQHSLPVFQPCSFRKSEAQRWVIDLNADIMVVVAYGLILPQEVLSFPRFGCINVHGSLLPRWRGAAPVQHALLAGDKQTGITIMQMDSGLDTGVMLHKATCAIQPDDTSFSLYNKLAKIGPVALLSTLQQIAAGSTFAEPQDDTFATYACKLSKKEARLDWRLPAVQLERCVRAFNPWPTSYFLLAGQAIKVWEVCVYAWQFVSEAPGVILSTDKAGIHISTGDGALTLTKLQLEGKKSMPVQDLLNSRREWFMPGTLLN